MTNRKYCPKCATNVPSPDMIDDINWFFVIFSSVMFPVAGVTLLLWKLFQGYRAGRRCPYCETSRLSPPDPYLS